MIGNMEGGAGGNPVGNGGGWASKVISLQRSGGREWNGRVVGMEEEVGCKMAQTTKVINREGNEGCVLVIEG